MINSSPIWSSPQSYLILNTFIFIPNFIISTILYILTYYNVLYPITLNDTRTSNCVVPAVIFGIDYCYCPPQFFSSLRLDLEFIVSTCHETISVQKPDRSTPPHSTSDLEYYISGADLRTQPKKQREANNKSN